MNKANENKPSRLVRIREDLYGKLLERLSLRQKEENKVVSLTQITNEQLEKSLIED